MFDDEKAIQHAERHRGHRKEIHCGDHLAVILQEGQPLLSRIPTATEDAQISTDGPFRNNESKFLQFSMDPGRSPIPILLSQTADDNADLISNLRPSAACA